MSDQGALFDESGSGLLPHQGGDRKLRPPEQARPGKAHAGAGDTERAAAEQIVPRAGTWRRRVLEAIVAAGDEGATDWELHVETGGLLYTIAPRRNELLNDKWIRDSGRRRKTPNGTGAIVWVMSERGKAQLDQGR